MNNNNNSMKRRFNTSGTAGSWAESWQSILRRMNIGQILCVAVFMCIWGIYGNLRELTREEYNHDSGINSRSYLIGLPQDMARKLVAGNLTLEEEAQNAFSACLIVMDDNHWLIEWISYHYHVLPLRHLIVVIDPRSHTSPLGILDRWRDKMIIEEWVDEDFLPEWVPKKAKMGNVSDLWLHLNRQNFFYGQCLQSLHKRGRSWVTLTDTDEFIRVNPYRHRLKPNIRKQPGYVLNYLHQLGIPAGNQSCLLVPRIQISSVERPSSRFPFQTGNNAVSRIFNTSDFLTLRFLYHNEQEMDAGKNVIYLKNIPFDELPPKRTKSVHHALDSCPENSNNMLRAKDSHLQIQHYLGTLEQFTYRDDPRDHVHNRRATWFSRGRNPEPTKKDDDMEPWLIGFMENQGPKEAAALLKDVGKVPPREDHDSLKRILPLPPPRPSNFSACLLVKDDNHYLIEWLGT